MLQSCIQMKSRPYLSGPRISYLNFNFFPLIGGALYDIPVHAPFPSNAFYLSSVKTGNEADSILMTLAPIYGKRGNNPSNNMTGRETGGVIWLSNTVATGPVYRTFVRFKEPIQDFFLSIGTETGQAPTFTLACVEDDSVILRSGIFRSF